MSTGNGSNGGGGGLVKQSMKELSLPDAPAGVDSSCGGESRRPWGTAEFAFSESTEMQSPATVCVGPVRVGLPKAQAVSTGLEPIPARPVALLLKAHIVGLSMKSGPAFCRHLKTCGGERLASSTMGSLDGDNCMASSASTKSAWQTPSGGQFGAIAISGLLDKTPPLSLLQS